MDSAKATLIASVLAATASLVTLMLRAIADRHAEARSTFRQSLGPAIEELGNALHMTVACSVLSVRDRDTANRSYWDDKKAEARKMLRKLRPRLRYQLWGLDDGIKAMICLADWTGGTNQLEYTRLLNAATKLRKALDASVRRCYLKGRPPSLPERWLVSFRVHKLKQEWRELEGALEAEDLSAGRSSQRLSGSTHDKIYATIVTRIGDEFTAKAEDGRVYTIKIAYRSGKGSRSAAQPGARVKLYQRSGEDFWRYRFLGG